MRRNVADHRLRDKHGKKGQIGDTITWFVATIVIVVVLLFFIFGASMFGSTKKVGKYKESITSKSTFEGGEPFLKKTIYTYLSVSQAATKTVLNRYLEGKEENGDFELSPREELAKVRGRHKIQ